MSFLAFYFVFLLSPALAKVTDHCETLPPDFAIRLVEGSRAHQRFSGARDSLTEMGACLKAFRKFREVHCPNPSETSKLFPHKDTDLSDERKDCLYYQGVRDILAQALAKQYDLQNKFRNNLGRFNACWQSELGKLEKMPFKAQERVQRAADAQRLPAERQNLEKLRVDIAKIGEKDTGQFDAAVAESEAHLRKLDALIANCLRKKTY
jgi:hypothetical protein